MKAQILIVLKDSLPFLLQLQAIILCACNVSKYLLHVETRDLGLRMSFSFMKTGYNLFRIF